MRKLLILMISIATLFGCSNDDDNDNTSGVKIRLSNASQFDFQNIRINTGSSNENVSLGNLKMAKKTDYKLFESAYRYAFVELEINGKTYTIQPIDYVGETLLEDGNYTYQINANDSQNQYQKLSMTLIEE
jgi:hypothetical protein